jgi:hypothetical protein
MFNISRTILRIQAGVHGTDLCRCPNHNPLAIKNKKTIIYLTLAEIPGVARDSR